MSRSKRIFRILAVLLLAAAALPVTAESILLAVRETADGAGLTPPLPAREGIAGSLFDAGFIVFDLPGDPAARSTNEMVRLARSAGAELFLDVRVQYTDRALGAGVVRITGAASFTLVDAATGVVKAKGQRTVDNTNREKNVDRAALGQELGRTLAARITDALSPGAR